MPVDLKSIHTELSQYFLRDLAEIDHQGYVPGTVAYDWRKGGDQSTCKVGAYEALLESFLLRDPGSSRATGDNMLVIVGGIGTGKSTSIRKAITKVLATPRKCSVCGNGKLATCEDTPGFIHLDFGSWLEDEEGNAQDQSRTQALQDKFWNYLAARMSFCNREVGIAPEEEVTEFWSWCLSNTSVLDRSATIHNFLFANTHEIESAKLGKPLAGISASTLVQSLLSKRRNFLENPTAEDLAWYKIFLLAYSGQGRKIKCPCAILFVDNVDHLTPFLQKLATNQAMLFSEILKSRSVVAIRPLTWERSIRGVFLVRTEPHYAPDWRDVINLRVGQYLQDKSPDEKIRLALESAVAKISGRDARDRLFGKVVESTTGLSVRWAFRNFLNMLESPRFQEVPDGPDAVRSMRVSDLSEAYFFGQRKSFIPRSFDNLYAIPGHSGIRNALIKPRILDLVCRVGSGTYHIRDAFELLERFGIPRGAIQLALNELMRKTRPLLWSSDGFSVEDTESMSVLVATPIGWGYYKNLFGELLYETLCVRSTDFGDSARDVYDFHQQLTDRDLAEIKYCIRKSGSRVYHRVYGLECPSIAWLHSTRLMPLLRRFFTSDIFFDPERENFIVEETDRVAGKPPTLMELGEW